VKKKLLGVLESLVTGNQVSYRFVSFVTHCCLKKYPMKLGLCDSAMWTLSTNTRIHCPLKSDQKEAWPWYTSYYREQLQKSTAQLPKET
jgi:hypothetical protein